MIFFLLETTSPKWICSPRDWFHLHLCTLSLRLISPQLTRLSCWLLRGFVTLLWRYFNWMVWYFIVTLFWLEVFLDSGLWIYEIGWRHVFLFCVKVFREGWHENCEMVCNVCHFRLKYLGRSALLNLKPVWFDYWMIKFTIIHLNRQHSSFIRIYFWT